MHPLPPVPDLRVTIADEKPENFVRVGGKGATSLIGNNDDREVEKGLRMSMPLPRCLRQVWHRRIRIGIGWILRGGVWKCERFPRK